MYGIPVSLVDLTIAIMVRVVALQGSALGVGNEMQEVRVDAEGSERRAEQRNDESEEAEVRRGFLKPRAEGTDIRFNDCYVIVC